MLDIPTLEAVRKMVNSSGPMDADCEYEFLEGWEHCRQDILAQLDILQNRQGADE